MSDTRAAIRELRSLSEKRSTQGLSAEERVRLDELRQRLGLPPEPELGTATPTGVPQAAQEAVAPAVRRPSLAERIDAAGAEEPAVAPGPMYPPGVNGTGSLNGTAAPLSETARPSEAPRWAGVEPVLPAEPAVAEEVAGAPEPVDDAGPAPLFEARASLELPTDPFTEVAGPLPSFDSPVPLPLPAPTAIEEPAAESMGEAPAAFDAPDAFPPSDPASVGESAAFDTADAFPPSDPASVGESAAFDGADAFPPSDPASVGESAAFDGADAFPPSDPPFEGGDAFPASEPVHAEAGEAPPEESFLTATGVDGSVAEAPAHDFLEDPGVASAAEIPPDGPLPGDDGFGAEPLPPGSGPVAELPAEEGYGAEPLTPAPVPSLLLHDAGESGDLVLAAEDLGATPLDPLPEEEVHAQPLEESGPIELSAADVMLLEDDPRRDVSGLELGGDAAEPVPLAEAADFVQYQRQDDGAIALEPASGEEGLGDPALLQASEAELAAQAAPFVRPPAAPSLRVPPPPPTSAPLPRTATASSMPAARPPSAIPAASVPAARAPAFPPPPSAASVPRPAASAPPPPPPPRASPPSRAVPTAARSTPTVPGPIPLVSTVAAPAAHGAPTPAPPAAARPVASFPVLTPAAPAATDSPPGRSGPFARPPPSLMPAAALDTMDEEPVAPPPGHQSPMFGGPYLSPTFIEGEHRVVLHTLEGQVRRGTMNDVDLLDPVIRLNPSGALPDAIPAERIKAIFFMQGPGATPLPQHGQRIRVSFSDGRQIVGFSEDVEVGENGFFLVPADLRTHTARIYVFRAGVHSITRA